MAPIFTSLWNIVKYPSLTCDGHTHTHTHTHTQLHVRKSSTESPVHLGRGSAGSPLVNIPLSASTSCLPRRESSSTLPPMGGASGPTPPGPPRVNVSFAFEDQPLDRQGIISITADVQNFLAAISRLRQAMQEADNEGKERGREREREEGRERGREGLREGERGRGRRCGKGEGSMKRGCLRPVKSV